MVAPKREQEKNYLDSETIIMIMFCKLVEIYLLFDYSYFPICFATIFLFMLQPLKTNCHCSDIDGLCRV